MTNLELIAMVATSKMRPATEDDNPYFFGPGVWCADLDADSMILFGQDEDGQMAIFYQHIDHGFVQLDLAVTDRMTDEEG